MEVILKKDSIILKPETKIDYYNLGKLNRKIGSKTKFMQGGDKETEIELVELNKVDVIDHLIRS